MQKTNRKTVMLTEGAVMLALSTVLSLIAVWQMPMGGSVTLFSMLPVLLYSVKYGIKGGVPVAFAFSLIQTAIGFIKGSVFVYTKTLSAFVVCLFFDYIIPFTVLGLGGFLAQYQKQKFSENKRYALVLTGFTAVILVRFLCHFVTGFTIWGQWAAEGQSKYIYSLLYNGQYMLPEGIITVLAGGILLRFRQIRKLLNFG